MTISRFQRGASTYKCRNCQHVTRSVEGDELDVLLCLPCYELCGYENALNDEGVSVAMQYKDRVAHMIDVIERRPFGHVAANEWKSKFAELLK